MTKMRIEDSDDIPNTIEDAFERLGWRQKRDRKYLWSAMKHWVLEPGKEHRKYLTGENVKEEFKLFIKDVYVPRLLTEQRGKRNPQVNISKPSGAGVSDEILNINRPLRTALLLFTGYFKSRKGAKEEIARLESLPAAGGTDKSQDHNGNANSKTSAGWDKYQSDNDSDEPLLNSRKRSKASIESGRSKRSSSSQSSKPFDMDATYKPTNSNVGATREAIINSLNYMDRIGIYEQGKKEDLIRFNLPIRARPKTGQLQASSMPPPSAPTKTQPTGSSFGAHAQRKSVPSTPGMILDPYSIQIPITPQAPGPSSPSLPRSSTNFGSVNFSSQGSPQQKDRNIPESSTVTSAGPKFQTEYWISTAVNHLQYTGSLNGTLFDTVAAYLSLDSEDVSTLRITLQDPPPKLQEEHRTRVIDRREADGMETVLKDLAIRAARKYSASEVKREGNAAIVFVIEDVPPSVM